MNILTKEQRQKIAYIEEATGGRFCLEIELLPGRDEYCHAWIVAEDSEETLRYVSPILGRCLLDRREYGLENCLHFFSAVADGIWDGTLRIISVEEKEVIAEEEAILAEYIEDQRTAEENFTDYHHGDWQPGFPVLEYSFLD